MVRLVHLPTRLDNGPGNMLPDSKLFSSMVWDVVRNCQGQNVKILYCSDGSSSSNVGRIDDKKELDALCKLIREICGNVLNFSTLNFSTSKFSFQDEGALQMLEGADIFYWNSFGAKKLDDFSPIVGESVPANMARLVETFQSKCMFGRMLTITACAAAIVTGADGLSLLGDASVVLQLSEPTAKITPSLFDDVVQLVPGVANIIQLESGCVEVERQVVVPKRNQRYMTFAEFAASSQGHLETIMKTHSKIWRIYYSANIGLWACRADGGIIWGMSLEGLVQHCTKKGADRVSGSQAGWIDGLLRTRKTRKWLQGLPDDVGD